MATIETLAHQPEQAECPLVQSLVRDRLAVNGVIPTRHQIRQAVEALDAWSDTGDIAGEVEAMLLNPGTPASEIADHMRAAIDAVLPRTTWDPHILVNRSQLLQYLAENDGAEPGVFGVEPELRRMGRWRGLPSRDAVLARHAVYAVALTADPGPHATVEIPRPVAEVLAWAAVAHEPDRFACEDSGQSRTTTTALPLWWRDVLDDLPRGWAALQPAAWAHALEVLTAIWGTEL